MHKAINGAAAAEMVHRNFQESIPEAPDGMEVLMRDETLKCRDEWYLLINQLIQSSQSIDSPMEDAVHEKLSEDIKKAEEFFRKCQADYKTAFGADISNSDIEKRKIAVCTIIVHMLCALHCAKNCGLTSELAKNLITKAARAPTEESLQYYLTVLKQHFPAKNCEDFEARKNEWSTVALLALGGSTNLGETNTNSSEQGHTADNFLRYSPIVDAVTQWLVKKNQKQLTRQLKGSKMKAKGRSFGGASRY
jgi:hypothetical protein